MALDPHCVQENWHTRHAVRLPISSLASSLCFVFLLEHQGHTGQTELENLTKFATKGHFPYLAGLAPCGMAPRAGPPVSELKGSSEAKKSRMRGDSWDVIDTPARPECSGDAWQGESMASTQSEPSECQSRRSSIDSDGWESLSGSWGRSEVLKGRLSAEIRERSGLATLDRVSKHSFTSARGATSLSRSSSAEDHEGGFLVSHRGDETLSALALRYNVALPLLLRANSLRPGDQVYEGRILRIPRPGKKHHPTRVDSL